MSELIEQAEKRIEEINYLTPCEKIELLDRVKNNRFDTWEDCEEYIMDAAMDYTFEDDFYQDTFYALMSRNDFR